MDLSREEAFVGDRAPDTPVVTLNSKKTRISNFFKANRPLLDEFKQLVKDFGAVADFLIVYIAKHMQQMAGLLQTTLIYKSIHISRNVWLQLRS
ncbi:hypothetical protein AAFF_G00124730 [Aldrovandia affinis]|uniref:Uncharacterized protein n=1 Tax=Aldrovandia affinis TaxID=143900 RepID=A0AAD7R110_9TELE|nr:hypothetical protein AAFF_G00124730 [Aldrovandia affinis]